MNIEANDIDDITILVIDGMVTIGSDHKLGQAFQDLVARGRTKLIIDMTRVKYIDSLGIGQIAGGYTMVDEAGGNLVLARSNEKIQELLKLTGLQNHILTYPTVEDALKAL